MMIDGIEFDITEIDLEELFLDCHKAYFVESYPTLGEISIKWAKDLKTKAGLYHSGKKEITLCATYHSYYPEKLINTLVHEMLHIRIFNHGPVFQAAARSLNQRFPELTLATTTERRPLEAFKHVYQCEGCGRQFGRQRKLKDSMYCCDDKALVKIN